ncbi:MAG: hypothetical protein N2746_01420, partial [Deltaproteobacteria bacterium]|nr:hypothetical protein [Deltaproteobacteria bacterium]
MKKDLINTLKSDKNIYAACPDGDEFPLSQAIMFYADGPIPDEVKKLIKEKENELEERKSAIKEMRRKLKERSETATRTTNIGKVLEKVAPAIKGFQFDRRDCRA